MKIRFVLQIYSSTTQFISTKILPVHLHSICLGAGPINATWDSRTSVEDMESLWNDPYVNKEWTKSGEKKGNVRFSHDVEKHPYLSRLELMVRNF